MNRRDFLSRTKGTGSAVAAMAFLTSLDSNGQNVRDNSGWKEVPGYNGKLQVKVLWLPDELATQPTSPFSEATCAAYRVAAGVEFPRHKHQADELTYVIDGAFVQNEIAQGYWQPTNTRSRTATHQMVQKVYKKGDVLFMPSGSIHEVNRSLGAVILTFNARKNLLRW
jgi:quercetin dioxygenase-like cupin family protein